MDAPTPSLDEAVAQIRAAAAAGSRGEAIDLAIAAMSRDLGHPVIWRWVAEGLEEDGRGFEGLPLFNRAQAEAPDDVELKLVFASALIRHDAHLEAIAPVDAVLERNASDFDALMLRGTIALALHDLDGARSLLLRTLEAWPDRIEPRIELATLAAQQGRWAEAREHAESALSLAPGAARASLALARVELAAKSPASAKGMLDRLAARPDLDPETRAEVLTLAGDALDALDRPREAFAAWRAREALIVRARAPAFRRTAPDANLALARKITDAFGRLQDLDWSPAAPSVSEAEPARGPVFLLSFPRSGATLLEQVLGSHPGAVALDERPALSLATDAFLTDADSLRRLASIGPEEAAEKRAAYWARVRQDLGQDVGDRVFVDKNPLNTFRLPIIAKLFPHARILFAQRDPRDVVLSCWRRLYFSHILEFMTLQGTAEFYAATMALWELFAQRLATPIHVLRHEALVEDFEGETRRALDFIGLPWDAAVTGFASAPVVNVTPSAAQVRRGLTSEGVGQWRRHAIDLASVASLVEPWARRFGYPANDLSVGVGVGLKVGGSRPPAAALDEIHQALQAGRLPRAMALAEEALAQGQTDPLLHRLRGARAQQDGRLDLAITDFQAALAMGGEDPALLNALGLCLARAGRGEEGLIQLDRAIELNDAVAAWRYNRGWTLESLGELARAADEYAQALRLDPRHAAAAAALANLAARRADWAQAIRYADAATAIDPRLPTAHLAHARAEIARGDAASAERRLREALQPGRAAGHDRAVLLEALGDALDAQDRPEEAFAAYARSADLLRALYAPRFHRPGVERAADFARRLQRTFAGEAKGSWRRGAPREVGAEEPLAHVFVLGFPRSGTTLMGQVLAGGADVVVLDERRTLAEASRAYLSPRDGPARLAQLGEDEVERQRALYWGKVRAAGVEPAGKVLVDKLPLNTLGLPLIARLFPRARVVFMQRDPRDVILSCFRRQFAVDATTVEFLELGWAADLYDAVMSLADTYEQVLDLDIRRQSQERLIADFEGEMRNLCAFAGIAFDPGMAAFADRAGNVATPSAAQLARGLTSEGVGAWRRYARPMQPVLPRLAPWVTRFGYDPD